MKNQRVLLLLLLAFSLKNVPPGRFLQNVVSSQPPEEIQQICVCLDAHVQELEHRLEKERQAVELMREELVEAKRTQRRLMLHAPQNISC
ncbi:hypothetical protein D1007_59068 [Hordeum vulgare]|nr:hypothetical protein D1007_59068 [Hordeum vulgare]